jgi:glycosyltransferase involved in cell wall biosynthesis
MNKIHYHSDCPFFAGCENMLINFFNSNELRGLYEISFSFRYSERYSRGLSERLNNNLTVYPIFFPDLSDYEKLPVQLSLLAKRVITSFIRLIFTYPILIYEIYILFKLFKKIKPDIVHINNGGYPAALSARAAVVAGLLAKVPKLVMVVNNMAVDYKKNIFRWLDYPLDYIVAKNVDYFITGSISASERIQRVLNLPSSKLITIHNGITIRPAKEVKTKTLERLGLKNFSGVIFGVVALLIPRKGHIILLSAILKLKSESRIKVGDFKVLIEGDGPLKVQLEKFVVDNDLSQWVVFLGVEANIVDFMSVLDVLILPSVQDEDFPNVILESMALSKPAIASRLAGTPEQIVDGLTGILVEPKNACDLANSILLLIENSDLRIGMGLAALHRFNDQFTTDKSLYKYINLYQKLTN